MAGLVPQLSVWSIGGARGMLLFNGSKSPCSAGISTGSHLTLALISGDGAELRWSACVYLQVGYKPAIDKVNAGGVCFT